MAFKFTRFYRNRDSLRGDVSDMTGEVKLGLSEDRVALSVGNRALGALMAMGHARVVFTTNFDSVVEKSVAEVAGSSLSAFHLEGSYAANTALDNED